MELRTLELLRDSLKAKAAEMLAHMPDAAPDLLVTMVPQERSSAVSGLEEAESVLGRALPPSARDVLEEYELAGLELAGVIFGAAGTLSSFLVEQLRDPVPYWGDCEPVAGIAILGSSSGCDVLMSLTSGVILARTRFAPEYDGHVVAGDLDRFLRALASLALTETVDDDVVLSRAIAEAVGAERDAFWLDLIRGHG